ncbi:TIGR00341 family protein [Altererythrobacter sp. HHU K3-1]|uniref:TIGR00341 family protein n=2 Tax=Qipengyuania atrilutea TaxID=2744473 RepID=A0A850HE82_9SPHN|nr:TIGR00341 family protein [Actirhodobacter atriluteus]
MLERDSFAGVILSWRRWWRDAVVGTVDKASVIEKRREECLLSARYLFMIAMSGGIAILGLLLSSPAVVIGAMLLSPLMGPIMGLGFALAVGDYKWMRQSMRSLLAGTVIAIALCALIVFVSPLQTVTSEIASRTRPNLFDLMVAVFSALAGAYAMIRGREGTIVGVAIATALMPPIAVVGFGLATFNWTVFSGALLLYVTNLVAIALIAMAMARLYGFSSTLSERSTLVQNVIVVSVFVALAIPLGLTLIQIGWEAQAQRVIRSELLDGFDDRARLSQIDIDWDAEPLTIDATVLTPRLEDEAERFARQGLERELDRPVNLTLTQYLVGTSASAAEEAQLQAARAQEEAAANRAEELAARLSIVAGVDPENVTVDRQRRRALVTAQPLEGASLAAYRELERRITDTEQGWDVRITPPLRDLPDITFEEKEPDAAGRRALALAAWASSRTGVPVRLSGPAGAVAAASQVLSGAGVQFTAETDGEGFGPVTVNWNTGDTE